MKWIAERLGRTTHAIRAWMRRNPELFKGRTRRLNLRAKRLVGPGMRLCRRCERILPVSEFHPDRSAKSGLQSRCKRCGSEQSAEWNRTHPEQFKLNSTRSRRRRKYGLEPGDFDAMLEAQNGMCPICLSPLGARIDVDHDHATRRARGLLHFRCNTALGALGDSAETLSRAIRYLNQE